MSLLESLQSLFRRLGPPGPGLTGTYECSACGLKVTAEGPAEFIGRSLQIWFEHTCVPEPKTLK